MIQGAAGGIDHARDTAAEDSGRALQGQIRVIRVPLVGIRNGDQGHNGQNALDQHAAVSDGLRVGLLIQLLGGGAGGDQRVEAGDSAAGDGGEQHGEHRSGVALGVEHGQAVHGGMAHHNGHGRQDQHGVQQEGGQIVTGLEQDPDGGDGGDQNVHAHDPHPRGGGQVDGVEVQADEDDGHDGDHADDGGNADGSVAAVDAVTEDDGDQDEQQGHHGHLRVGLRGLHVQNAVHIGGAEGAGHDGRESGHDQNQGQIRENDEQALGAQGHVGGDDLADGLAAVADRGEQRAEVMHAAEENTADQDPQRAGQPAEAKARGADGAGDGARAGDGGEVVAHQDGSLCGDIVHAVLHGMCGGLLFALTDTPLLAQPAAIEDIAAQQYSDADDQKY